MMSLHRLLPVLLALAAACSVLSVPAGAHGPKGHKDRAISEVQEQNAVVEVETAEANTTAQGEDGANTGAKPRVPAATLGERIGAFFRALHPASVHFPIAFFLLAGVLEAASIGKRAPAMRDTVNVLVKAGAIGAIAATVLGWIHTGLWFGGDTVMQWHRWSGTALAIAGILAAFLAGRPRRGALRVLLAIMCAGLVIQGFWGAELAHGANHLA